MYKVVKHFVDLQDNNYSYKVGETYPRKGYTATDERIAELAGKENKQGEPLIKKVKSAKKTADK